MDKYAAARSLIIIKKAAALIQDTERIKVMLEDLQRGEPFSVQCNSNILNVNVGEIVRPHLIEYLQGALENAEKEITRLSEEPVDGFDAELIKNEAEALPN